MMTYVNLINNNIHHAFGGLFDSLTNAQMEHIQFGIFDYFPKKLRKFPFSLLI